MTYNFTEHNIALCNALGLEPNDVYKITVRMDPDVPPCVEVEFSLLYLSKHPEFTDALREFTLVPKGELQNSGVG